ncbi:MAG TPA: tripartite tricarboxylate transporter substrate-binding protein [Burkholderiales bacterium]|nr:tripartite tricarboxylate transporter substrate-binding protein [Burkholderiales bacterium]
MTAAQRTAFAGSLAMLVMAGLCVAPAAAQTYPSKTIRIVTSPAGGGNDFPARLIARALAAPLGQQLVVDNRATVLIADIVAKAPPDGHTLLVTGSAHWIGPLVEKTNYDPIRDFAPITLIDRAPSVLVVHPSMPVKNVRQLIALAKAKPGQLNFSVGGPGTSNYIAAILFNHMAGVNVVRIPYKGTGPALTAVMVGEVHAMFGSAGGAAPHVTSGRLRALAVGSAQPSPLAPGVPTLEASGLPGFLSEALHALFAPAGTPQAIVGRLNQEVSRYLQSPEARDIFLKAGIEVAPGTPEELTATMKAEIARLGSVLKAAGAGVQ